MRNVTILAVVGVIASAHVGCSSSSTNMVGGNDGGLDAGPRCNPAAGFAPPTKIAELSGAYVVNARPTQNELEAYLGIASSTPPAYIAYASRSSTLAGFGEPSALQNAPDGDNTTPAPTPDGQRMAFAHRAPGETYHLWTTDLSKTGFSNPQPLTVLESSVAGVSEQSAFVASRSENLYYTTDVNGQFDIWISRYEQAQYQPGAPVPGLESTYHEGSPVVTGDEHTIYFGSNRLDVDASTGPDDIFVATWDETKGAFGTPTAVDALNTESRDYPTWISDDGCVIYFLSNRGNADGRLDVYRSQKP